MARWRRSIVCIDMSCREWRGPYRPAAIGQGAARKGDDAHSQAQAARNHRLADAGDGVGVADDGVRAIRVARAKRLSRGAVLSGRGPRLGPARDAAGQLDAAARYRVNL